ncbi:MAG TPA: MFS transporter [Euzebyales bacterium]|nr:MFS transporter [Euzebyales bacterium]
MRTLAPSSGTPAERTARELLVDPTFGRYFLGNLTSNCGNWIQNVAAATAVYSLTRSATLTGVVSGALWIGSLFLQPYAGVVSDRVDRRRMLLAGQVLSFAAASVLAVWTVVAGLGDLPGPWPIIVATVIIGIGNAVSTPSMQALVPALVPPADLEQAVALNSVTFTLGRALGPALAAGILLLGGPTAGFVVNAVTYVPLIVVLLVIRQREIERSGAGEGSVREVLRLVRHDRRLSYLLVATATIGWTADPVNTLTPPMADLFGGGNALVGVFVGCFGGGAATASLILRRIRRRVGLDRLGVGGLGGFGIGVVLFAVSPTPWLAAAALALAGMAFLGAITVVTTRLQQDIAEDVRGRMMALWGVAFLGSRPVAALINGVVADAVGPRVASALAASMALVGAVVLSRAPRVHATDSDR